MSRLTGPDAAIRRLAVARLISQGGTQAANIALIALVFERSNGSGVWIAAALLASLGARVVASPWAGTLGDYFDRRWVMVGSDLAAAGVFVVITETRSLTALVVLAALAGAAEAPFGPAANGLVAMLVPVERRGWANGTLSIGMSAGGLLGAALGGLLVAGVGASGAFLVNAVSFAVSAVLSASISGRFVSGARHEREHRGAWKGVQLLVGQRTLRLSAFSVALVALALGMVNVVQLPFFADIGAGKVGWGIALAAFGAGEICAGRLASRLVDARLERLALIAGCAVASVALAVTGATSAFVLAAVLFAATGFSNTLIVLGLVLSVQRWAPQELQGRTMAAVEAIVQSAIGVSLVVGGLLLSPLGAHGVYLLAGGLGCIGVVFALRIPRQPDPIRPDEEPAATVSQTAGGIDLIGLHDPLPA